MARNLLTTVQGDLLEFDIILWSSDPADEPIPAPPVRPGCCPPPCPPGQRLHPRPLYEGEKLFFITDTDSSGTSINIEQADIHFKIDAVELSPGQYPFRAGLIYSTGDRKTVFDASDSVLTVRRP